MTIEELKVTLSLVGTQLQDVNSYIINANFDQKLIALRKQMEEPDFYSDMRKASTVGKQIREIEDILERAKPLKNKYDGNEFLIYMIGYTENQVEIYTKKLSKTLKELPYGFGAAIGYSMIMDNIKTIDDAINEATIEMQSDKESYR